MEEVIHLLVIGEGAVGEAAAVASFFGDLFEDTELFPFELADLDAHFFGFSDVVSSISLEVSEELIRGAAVEV